MAGSLKNLVLIALAGMTLAAGCAKHESITDVQQLAGKAIAVPTGTVADKLVLSKIPTARFQYYNTVLDGALAVKTGKVAAVAYDEPILKNIAAKNPGLTVLPQMITTDTYGFAVAPGNKELKTVIDEVLQELKQSGGYAAMMNRWFPKTGSPAPMPQISSDGTNGTLRFGTAAVTEPFSFVDASHKVVGFDIEIAALVAKKLGKRLEVVNMDFGAMIPALVSGKVEMIGACITITDERAKSVLFSESYYTGGIAALVRQ